MVFYPDHKIKINLLIVIMLLNISHRANELTDRFCVVRCVAFSEEFFFFGISKQWHDCQTVLQKCIQIVMPEFLRQEIHC